MDRTWTWRDWIFLFLFLFLVFLIFLQIKQNDRQYERLTEMSEEFKELRRLVERGGITAPTPGDDNQTSQIATGDWLVIRMQEPAGTLNPITYKDAYAGSVNGYIMESLLERNPKTLKLEPRLAESMPEISEDKKQFTFRLRKGIHWQDGPELTADDVVFSYHTIMNPKVDCQNIRNYFQDIEKCEKLDQYTVRFTTKKVYWLWVSQLGGMAIVPKHLFQYDEAKAEEFNRNPWGLKPIGTGPYRFLKWDEGQQIVLVRDGKYWNKEKAPHVDRIVFKFVLNDTAAMELVKKQQIDSYGPSEEQWFRDAMESEVVQHYRRMTYNSLFYNYLGWNQRTVFFKDRRVRLAMTHAVPRQKFLQTRMRGLGKVVSGNFYVGSDAYNRKIQTYPYDLAEARRLLDEAGWKDRDGDGFRENEDGKKFAFQLLLPSERPVYADMALTVKAELAKIGVKMTTRALDWASFITEIDNRNFDAVTLGWSLSLEPDPYQLWHSTQTGASGSNFCNFVNKEADKIIEDARVEFDDEKRNKMFHRFHEIMHYEQPYTFLFNRPALRLLHNRFENVNVYELGPYSWEWWVKPENRKYGLAY